MNLTIKFKQFLRVLKRALMRYELYVLRYVPTFCVIEIPGPTIQQAEERYTYRIPEQDNMWEAVQIILRCFRTLVDAPIHIKDDGFATTDESQYKILREALVNMVMHCDHFDSLRSCIRVYTDHIEFMNGGAFPLPVKDILGKIYSKLRNPTIAKLFRFVGIAQNAGYVTQADKDRMRPELRHKMYQDISSKNAPINKYLKKIAEKPEIEKPLSMHISRHSFAHIAQESGAEFSAIKNILGHSNLATTERYMGSFDTSKTDEILRNVFAKRQPSATTTEESGTTKEEQAIELLKGMTPEQIMAVISAINK